MTEHYTSAICDAVFLGESFRQSFLQIK